MSFTTATLNFMLNIINSISNTDYSVKNLNATYNDMKDGFHIITTKTIVKDILGYDNTINILVLKYSQDDILYIVNCGKFRNSAYGINENIINSYIFSASNLKDESSININILKMTSNNDSYRFGVDYTSVYDKSLLSITNIGPCTCDKIWTRTTYGVKCNVCETLLDVKYPLYSNILDRINLSSTIYNSKIPENFKTHINSLFIILKPYARTYTKNIK